MSTSGPSSSSTARPAKRGYRYEEDDEDLAPAAATKADWKSNPFVPLGQSRGALRWEERNRRNDVARANSDRADERNGRVCARC